MFKCRTEKKPHSTFVKQCALQDTNYTFFLKHLVYHKCLKVVVKKKKSQKGNNIKTNFAVLHLIY